MNAVNDYKWILNIIKSCNNDFHFEGVDKLIELFATRHGNVSKFDSLLYDLLYNRKNQWDHIHTILN